MKKFQMSYILSIAIMTLSSIPFGVNPLFIKNNREISSNAPGANSLGSISGHIYEANGTTPIPHIAILVEDENNTFEDLTCADASGFFQIDTIPLDLPVRLRADSYPGANWCNAPTAYLQEYWGQTTPYGGPGLITLTNAVPSKPNADFYLDIPGSEPDPSIDAWYLDGFVEALDWPLNTHIKLTIENPSTLLTPDYSAESDVIDMTDFGPTIHTFNLSGLFQLNPGMKISISGNYTTKIITVHPLTITNIDMASDIISGTSMPNNWMWMYFQPSCCRAVTSDANGDWSIDYSVEGPKLEPIADIGYQSEGAIHIPSGGGGKTSVMWSTGSGSGEIDSGGGVVTTPNTDTSLEIPSGAISAPVQFTITDEGGGVTISTDQGNLDAISTKTIGPEGTTFLIPVTITLKWLDETNDGIVDGTTTNEKDLYISKNGVVIAGPCSNDLGCDATNNSFSVQVSSLSFFALGAKKPVTLKSTSTSSNDGWVLEATETSNNGGSMNSSATSFNLGDSAADQQYRAILSFDTSALPDTAVITSATLSIKKKSLSGTDPFTILGSLKIDLRKPAFGNPILELLDFNTTAGKKNMGSFNPVPVGSWYSANIKTPGLNYINRLGTTQVRLTFTIDDNDDGGADFMQFFSGNAPASSRPKLILQYYLP